MIRSRVEGFVMCAAGPRTSVTQAIARVWQANGGVIADELRASDRLDVLVDAGVAGGDALALAHLPALRRSSFPAIVHVASLAGGGVPASLTQKLALEWARDGVRVNAVSVAFVEDMPDGGPAQSEARREQRIPMRRRAKPEEIANLVVYLASPASSFITAQVFNCDGGFSQSLYAAPMTRPGSAPA